MTELMIELTASMTAGTPELSKIATALLPVLIVIDLIWSTLKNLEQDYFRTLPVKIFKYGMWIWIVTQYDSHILKPLTDFFVGVGAAAGGMHADVSVLKDPSAIIDAGIEAMQPLTDNTHNSLGTTIANWLLYLIGLAGYAIAAFQIFLTVLEYHVVTSLAVILLPFGVVPKTAFLAEKAISSILSFCIKLMILAYLASVCVPILHQFVMNSSTVGSIVAHIVKVLAIAYLLIRGPSLAASLLSGMPSLSGESAVQSSFASGYEAAKTSAGEAERWTGFDSARAAASATYHEKRAATASTVMSAAKTVAGNFKDLFK